MHTGFLSSRTGKFFLETGTRTIFKIISGLGNIAITWWLVKHLGDKDFGIFRAASSSASILALAGGGMSAAAYGLIVRAFALNDNDEVKSIVTSSLKYLGVIGLAIILLSWPLGLVLAKIYGINPEDFHQFSWTATIATCSLAMGFFSMPFVWVVQARQIEYILNTAHIPLAIIGPIVVCASAWLFPEPWSPALGMLGMVIIGNTVCIILSSILNPWLWPLKVTKGHKNPIASRTSYAIIEQIAVVILGQALAWSVTTISGPSVFGIIIASMTFFAFTRDALSTVASTLVAPIGSLFHQGEKQRAISAWNDAFCLILLTGGSIAGTLAINNSSIINLWLGEKMNAGHLASLLMAGSLLLGTLNFCCQAAIYAADGYRERAFLLLIEALGGLALAWALGNLMGELGCLLGLLLVQALVTCAYIFFILKRMGTTIGANLSQIVRLFAVIVGITIFLSFWLVNQSSLSWIFLIAKACACQILLLSAGWFIGINPELRQRLFLRGLSIIKFEKK